MAWIRIESSVARNRKFVQAGPGPSWLWLCGLGYCQEGLTDGFIPNEAIDYLGVRNARNLAKHLVTAGLWDEADGGWQVHDYLDHNKSAAEIRSVRVERRKAGSNGGKVSGLSRRSTDGFASANVKQVASVNVKQVDEASPKQTANPSTSTSTDTATSTAHHGISAEPHSDSSPVVMEFPVVGDPERPTWELRQSRIDRLAEAYPNLDVVAQCRKARVWAEENPGKRKTARGMSAFLFKWMDNATNRGDGARAVQSGSKTAGNIAALQSFIDRGKTA